MKTKILLILLLTCNLLTRSQVPNKFNYQAVVRNNDGAVVASRPVGIRFSILDGSATGAVQYSEVHSAATNTFGLINLQVGGGTVVSGNFAAISWNTGNKFLQVDIDLNGGTSYTTLATVELVAVPYAVQSEKAIDFAGTLSGDIGGTQSATVIQPNAVTTAKIAGGAVTSPLLANNAVTNPKIADNAVTANKIAVNAITAPKIAAGQVVKSIGGLTDDITLSSTGTVSLAYTPNTIQISGNGISGVTAGTGLTGGGTTGNVTLSVAAGGNGIAGTFSRSDHTHVGQTWSTNSGYMLRLYDYDVASTPLYINSYATGFSNSGISAQILNNTGQSVAVFGNTVSNDANAAGVFGQAYSNGAAKGVWGLANGANTFGIFGQANGANSWAGYFQGRVHVNGTLSKAAGSFRIDHPLDPANKTLSHSFVESPDMMNVYNGNVMLDANGEAVVTMPDWFEALNKDFRYQLTAMGKPSPGLYIAQEISGNRFKIAGGAPGGKVSWQVTGIRHDPYANRHRIPVEERKTGSEAGNYLFPEGYGQPARVKSPARDITPPTPPPAKD